MWIGAAGDSGAEAEQVVVAAAAAEHAEVRWMFCDGDEG
jgi:hypothetical protein